MTTVIVVVVVALVFFVTLCTVTFMVWKREEEMRTDSLRSIESNLQELGYRLSDDFGRSAASLRFPASSSGEHETRRNGTVYAADPFDWVRNQNADDLEERDVCIASDWEPEADDVNGEVPEVQAAGEQSRPNEQSVNDLSEPAVTSEGEMISADMEAGAPDALRTEGVLESDAPGTSETAEPDQPTEHELHETEETGISLDDIFSDSMGVSGENDIDDIIDIDDLAMLEELEDIDEYVNDYAADAMPEPENSVWYDIGQSGRRYTAEELDMLIKD